MRENEIFRTLKEILKNDICVESEVTKETALIRDLGMDSMDFVNYITQVELKFKIKILDEDIQNHQLGVIKNMINYLTDKLQE